MARVRGIRNPERNSDGISGTGFGGPDGLHLKSKQGVTAHGPSSRDSESESELRRDLGDGICDSCSPGQKSPYKNISVIFFHTISVALAKNGP